MRLYHGSDRRFPIGTILRPSREKILGAWIENHLEKRRPANKVSRLDAVYMASDQRFSDVFTYLYEVEPIGPAQRHDLGCLWELMRFRMKWYHERRRERLPSVLPRDLAQAIDNYWNGKPCGPVGAWEYLAKGARVVNVVSSRTGASPNPISGGTILVLGSIVALGVGAYLVITGMNEEKKAAEAKALQEPSLPNFYPGPQGEILVASGPYGVPPDVVNV